MKILISRRQRYVARVSILLIMVTLIAGMVGCGGGSGGGGESYTLTVNSTAGGVVAVNNVTIPGKTMFTYDPGTVVSLNATPSAGYHFINWTGNGTVANVTAANTTITMNGNYSITANFVAVYSLTITSFGGGTVTTPGVGTFTRDAGTVVNLVATPNADYQFVNWTGDIGTIDDVNAANTTITMNGDYSITANFVVDTVYAANWELEQVKTAELGYFGDHGAWPSTSANLQPTYISGTLKAIYYFDTGYGWVLDAIPTGWTGITFQPGVAGPSGDHGTWVKS